MHERKCLTDDAPSVAEVERFANSSPLSCRYAVAGGPEPTSGSQTTEPHCAGWCGSRLIPPEAGESLNRFVADTPREVEGSLSSIFFDLTFALCARKWTPIQMG